MTVLFGELLVPGWAQGPDAMVGLRDVTPAEMVLPCHNADPELFFAETPALIALAKSLCGECPVRMACLEGALSRGEPCGVWGGELFEDGVAIAAKRTPGRPRLRPMDVELAG